MRRERQVCPGKGLALLWHQFTLFLAHHWTREGWSLAMFHSAETRLASRTGRVWGLWGKYDRDRSALRLKWFTWEGVWTLPAKAFQHWKALWKCPRL